MDDDELLLNHDSTVRSKLHRWPEVAAALVACIAPLAGGMAHGYSSPAMPQLGKPVSEGGLALDPGELSWFAASVTIGAIIGGPIASLILDRFGRKFSLMACAFPLNVGWLLLVSATVDTVWLLDLGRVVVGIGLGMGTAIAPVYIAEVASPEMRGLLGSLFQTFIMTGVLLVFLIGIGINYVWLAIVSSAIACTLPLLMLLVPETPRWLINAGRHAEAKRAIAWLHNYRTNSGQPQRDYDDLVMSMHTKGGEKFKLKDAFNDKGIRKAIILSNILMAFQQFCGMNALAFYAEPILDQVGFGSLAGLLAAVLAAIMVAGTFLSSFFLDILGRKKMLMISGIVMCFSCVAFAVYSLLVQHKLVSKTEWYMKTLAVVSLSCDVAGFATGWGPAPWVVMSEILPNRARGMGSSIATIASWSCAFIVIKGFHLLQTTIGNTGTFFLFAVFNFAAVLFALFFIPETKGKSLEEIEQELLRGSNVSPVIQSDDDERIAED